jgi:hypothetical protein
LRIHIFETVKLIDLESLLKPIFSPKKHFRRCFFAEGIVNERKFHSHHEDNNVSLPSRGRKSISIETGEVAFFVTGLETSNPRS